MADTDLMGCTPCKGRGKLLGLGSITEDCSHCKGIGWVEKPSAEAEDDFLNGIKDIDSSKPEKFGLNVAKKKAGRPKQAKNAS